MTRERTRKRSRITVEFDDDRGTSGTATSTPSWLARLFGRRARSARVFWSSVQIGWCFVDGARVDEDLERVIKDQLRWRSVKQLPSAQVRQRRGPHDRI